VVKKVYFSFEQRRRVGRFGGVLRLRPLGVLLCATFATLVFVGDARATTAQYPDHDVYEGVFYRPSGSKISFNWSAESVTNRGEWRIYRGHSLDDFEFVDSTSARYGEASYRFDARQPLVDREYFQLRYRSDDGSETVLATVLLVGTELSTVIQPLPDGPAAAADTIDPRWDPPNVTSDLNIQVCVLPLGDRPEPAVPPPRRGA